MRHCEGAKRPKQSHQISVIAEIPSLRGVSETNDEAISLKIPSLQGKILNFNEVLETAVPKGLGRSSYKICEQWGLPQSEQNSRIPKNKFRIPRDCFASLAMTRILKFPKPVSSPSLTGGSHHKESRIPWLLLAFTKSCKQALSQSNTTFKTLPFHHFTHF